MAESLQFGRSEKITRWPVHVKDIDTKSASETTESNFKRSGSVLLPNNQILVTDYKNNTLIQLDTAKGILISELQLSGGPYDITKVKPDEVAVTVQKPNQIQLVSVTQQSLQECKAIPVDGYCHGITYNDNDKTFIVTFVSPGRVKIIDMSGTVLKTFDKDSTGAKLFDLPLHVALSPDMESIYVTDAHKDSVTSLTMNGEIKRVYKDKKCEKWRFPTGIYVHSSGLVYVVGTNSNTVQQIDPDSGKFTLLLKRRHELYFPWSISYCEVEDKLYLGKEFDSIVKVYEMKTFVKDNPGLKE